MKIENLVREQVIGNIKTGIKGENGLPKKLPYFNVEEDKATSREMVDIFKQLYPGKPTKLKIMFTSEDPFNFKYKRYVNNKVVCIGNDTKAITIGKDNKGNNTQIEIECNKNCEQRLSGKCKLIGSLKFVLVGIEAGGVWKINTSGGFSLSNIASEIVKYKKANMSIVGVPFELTLSEQQSLGYGVYYSLDLHRTDIKPQLTGEIPETLQQTQLNSQENKQLPEAKVDSKKETKKTKTQAKPVEIEVVSKTEEKVEKATKTEMLETTKTLEEKPKEDFSNYLVVKKFMPTMINNMKFDKVIFEDINGQDVEYVLHPKTNQEVLQCSPGSVIEMISSKVEANRNILCKYEIKEIINADGGKTEVNNELKEAV